MHQPDTAGVSVLRFSADVIPNADANIRLQEAVHRHAMMNEARTILLRYRHGNGANDSSGRLLSEGPAYNLPSLLQSQTRMKHTSKGPPPVKKDVAVAISNSLRIMSYNPDRTDENRNDETIDNRKSVLKGQNLNKKGNGQKALISANQPRLKGRPTTLVNQRLYPDPLLKADKSYLARISEISQLEIETIKVEKAKKLKRKKCTEL